MTQDTTRDLPVLPLPIHPEPRSMAWTLLERRAIIEYGQACYAAALAQPQQTAPECRGWVCPKCGTDRTKAACPQGHHAALTGACPMVGKAATAAPAGQAAAPKFEPASHCPGRAECAFHEACLWKCNRQAPAAEAAQPIGYLSPQQLPRIVDPGGEFGTYIPMRKTPAGNFTLAVYAQADVVQPPSAATCGRE
jgi:hypothetical protein